MTVKIPTGPALWTRATDELPRGSWIPRTDIRRERARHAFDRRRRSGTGEPTLQPIDAGRITRRFTQRIEAPPERVFPLLCPVREGDWLDGWRDEVEMIHSESGLAEEGCVFRTRMPGRPETVWMITRHDPTVRVVELCRVTTGLVATKLTIGVTAEGSDASAVQITYTFTPLGPDGAEFVRRTYSEESFREDMVWWQDSMNHWLRTGAILRAAGN